MRESTSLISSAARDVIFISLVPLTHRSDMLFNYRVSPEFIDPVVLRSAIVECRTRDSLSPDNTERVWLRFAPALKSLYRISALSAAASLSALGVS